MADGLSLSDLLEIERQRREQMEFLAAQAERHAHPQAWWLR